jgi:hypothetical protein
MVPLQGSAVPRPVTAAALDALARQLAADDLVGSELVPGRVVDGSRSTTTPMRSTVPRAADGGRRVTWASSHSWRGWRCCYVGRGAHG